MQSVVRGKYTALVNFVIKYQW